MTSEDLQKMRNYTEELQQDPVRLNAFLRKVMGPPKRTLEGKERDDILLLIAMMDPYEESNNQHIWTESWRVGDITYNHHFGSGVDELEEVIEEDE